MKTSRILNNNQVLIYEIKFIDSFVKYVIPAFKEYNFRSSEEIRISNLLKELTLYKNIFFSSGSNSLNKEVTTTQINNYSTKCLYLCWLLQEKWNTIKRKLKRPVDRGLIQTVIVHTNMLKDLLKLEGDIDG